MRAAIHCLALGAAVMATAGRASADLIFDNDPQGSTAFSSTELRYLVGAATSISDVAKDTIITGITVENHINALRSRTAEMQFLIYDVTTSQFVYESAAMTFQGDGLLGSTPTAKSSAPLSVLLKAGDSYDIGYISDTAFSSPFASADALPTFTEGNLTASASDLAFGGSIGSPTLREAVFSRMVPIQLSGYSVVPSPASLLLLGSGLLGLPARRLRCR